MDRAQLLRLLLRLVTEGRGEGRLVRHNSNLAAMCGPWLTQPAGAPAAYMSELSQKKAGNKVQGQLATPKLCLPYRVAYVQGLESKAQHELPSPMLLHRGAVVNSCVLRGLSSSVVAAASSSTAKAAPAAELHLRHGCCGAVNSSSSNINEGGRPSQMPKAAVGGGMRGAQEEQAPACVRASKGEKLRVAVALSGGVDSALTALMLKHADHDVIGVHMHNWDAKEEGFDDGRDRVSSADMHGVGVNAATWQTGEDKADGVTTGGIGGQHQQQQQQKRQQVRPKRVCSERDTRDAATVARQLGIPFHEVDFVRQYWDEVFSGFVAEYATGASPNPDLACNRAIKFGALLHTARALGAEAVATGHYAHIAPDGSDSSSVVLIRAADTAKDQTYFLASVPAHTLKHYLMPLGSYHKTKVRQLAAEAGLVKVSGKRSSRGICFVGPRSFGDFMAQYVEQVPGHYVDVDTGRVIAPCPDVLALTCGQRVKVAGRGVREPSPQAASQRRRRGPAQMGPEALYAAGKDVGNKVVWVASEWGHPALWVQSVGVGPITWVAGEEPTEVWRALEEGMVTVAGADQDSGVVVAGHTAGRSSQMGMGGGGVEGTVAGEAVANRERGTVHENGNGDDVGTCDGGEAGQGAESRDNASCNVACTDMTTASASAGAASGRPSHVSRVELMRCRYKVRYQQPELGWCRLVAVRSEVWRPSRWHTLLPPPDASSEGVGGGRSSLTGLREAAAGTETETGTPQQGPNPIADSSWTDTYKGVGCVQQGAGVGGVPTPEWVGDGGWWLGAGWQVVVEFETPERGVAPGQALVLYAAADTHTGTQAGVGGEDAGQVRPGQGQPQTVGGACVSGTVCLGAAPITAPGLTLRELGWEGLYPPAGTGAGT